MAKRKPGPHADLVKAAVALLKLHGIFCWVNNTGRLPDRNGRWVSFGHVGSADIIGVMPGGRFIGAEAKIGKDPVRQDQIDWMDYIEANGGAVIVFHDLDELDDWLAKLEGAK